MQMFHYVGLILLGLFLIFMFQVVAPDKFPINTLEGDFALLFYFVGSFLASIDIER
jgi:hypothetical protein